MVQVISVRKISKGKHCWSYVTQLPLGLSCSPRISIRSNHAFTVYQPHRRHYLVSWHPFHLCADDNQVSLRTNPNNHEQQVECFKKIESYISYLSNWMFNNKLKLSDDKTEFLLVGSKVQTSKLIQSNIYLGVHIISGASVAKT